MNHYKLLAKPKEERKGATNVIGDFSHKKKVDQINKIQGTVVLEEYDLHIDFLYAPYLDEPVTSNSKEQVEALDVANLEVLKDS